MPAMGRLGGTALGKAENLVEIHGLCSTEVQVLTRQEFTSQLPGNVGHSWMWIGMLSQCSSEAKLEGRARKTPLGKWSYS